MAGAQTAQERLAQAVRDRRTWLGLSVREAAKQAEISRGTWQALEDGSRVTRDHNYGGIQRALDWPPGEIDRILKDDADGQRGPTDAEIATWTFEQIGAYATRIAKGPEGLQAAIAWSAHAIDVLVKAFDADPGADRTR